MDNETTDRIDIEGHQVTIRPLSAADIDLERDFIDKLSAQSKHYRFLGGVNHLSTAQLKKLCDIDFDHRMAFMASVTTHGREEEIGVSRYAVDAGGNGCEFAVTVADQWQHKGLGTLLMRKLIEFARTHHVKRLYSIDLADNAHMRQLAGDLGMQAERDPEDARQVIYSLVLE
ncbi:GNAT family N-acetyltransferase [Exilibacterium tricleocarpae]|uniref:GNAT family N-acetyltransferase n=1 Tax=Exilibacterium tricleocarpae TaxID=2591008 RepID=A0A545TV62_9GAMM|nr:GNAT family N-acetyltransferase [Exilibacterium tricleocarpae]TQV81108.1 GNAT family N-acetyltransferase [Exilibacterium tricleocarpae]